MHACLLTLLGVMRAARRVKRMIAGLFPGMKLLEAGFKIKNQTKTVQQSGGTCGPGPSGRCTHTPSISAVSEGKATPFDTLA